MFYECIVFKSVVFKGVVMKLGSITNVVRSGVKPIYEVKQKPQTQVSKSVREEVLARRKRQKSFSIIDSIKSDLEYKFNEKIKDILGIRF